MTWRGAIELSKGIGLSVAAVAGVTGAIYAGVSEKAKTQIAAKLTDAGFGS